jgi:hypothetical protein
MKELDFLKEHFNGHVSFRERRPGIVQVLAPLFHEDGDMVDIFVDLPQTAVAGNGNTRVQVGDHGMTLMRLTYNYEVDTVNKERIFNRILAENRVQQRDGRLFIDTDLESLYPTILQFAQTVARLSSMQYFKREVIESLFYEQLREFIEERLGSYQPRWPVFPLADHEEYEVDYQFEAGPRPLYLFGIKDNSKARLATISCLEFQRRKLPFKSVMVHRDFAEAISDKDRLRITSASDKQFTSLDDFRENGPAFFDRERAV